MLRHHGKVAIVTGGSSGIGRAIVRRLASEGADVAIADIADGSESVAEAQSAGGKAYWVRCDLTDEAAIRSCTKLVAERSGAASIFVHSAASRSGSIKSRCFISCTRCCRACKRRLGGA